MKNIILVAQIVVSLFLIFIISIQTKGSGLGRSFGAGGGVSFKRRGLERLIFKSTFIFITLFIILAILQFFVK